MSRNEPTDNMRSSDKTLRSKSTVKRGNSLWRPVFFSAAFIYMELLFHIAIYHGIDSNIMHPLTFAIACGLTLSALTSFWHRIANAITAYTIWGIFTVYYIAQFVYYKIFRTFLSLVSIGGAHDAMNFKSVLFATLRANWYVILLFLLPLICLILLNRLKFTLTEAVSARATVYLRASLYRPHRPQSCGSQPYVFWRFTEPEHTLLTPFSTAATCLSCL